MNRFLRWAVGALLAVGLLSPAFANAQAASADLRPLVRNAQDAVVSIYPRSFINPETGRFSQSVGSGSIITRDGLILTNCHVACDGAFFDVKARINGVERMFAATFVTGTGTGDSRNDIAFLRIVNPPADLPVLPLGEAARLQVGEAVVAIGSPLGLENTVTSGIVSALNRPGVSIDGDIQHDADIFGGNSGGPLLAIQDGMLKIVGMNTYVIGSSKESKGLVFAVSVTTVRRFLDQIHNPAIGHPSWGMIGVQLENLRPQVAQALGVPVTDPTAEYAGSYIVGVARNSAAAEAGLRPRDIVVRFNGVAVSSTEQLRRLVTTSPVGQSVAVDVIRDGRPVIVNVTPREAWQAPRRVPAAAYPGTLGLALANPTESAHPARSGSWFFRWLANLFGLSTVLDAPVVSQVYNLGPAHEAGINKGMYIVGVQVQGRPFQVVRTRSDLERYLAQAGTPDRVVISVALPVGNRGGSEEESSAPRRTEADPDIVTRMIALSPRAFAPAN